MHDELGRMVKEAVVVYLRLYSSIILKASLNQYTIFESRIELVTSQNADSIILALKCTLFRGTEKCMYFFINDCTLLPTKATFWLAANRCTDQTRV